MHSEYIEQRNGGYYVVGTRVSLDSVVIAFNRSETPSEILESYPALGRLARIYEALAFYLDNQPQIDEYIEAGQREFEAGTIPMSVANPELWEKLQRARARMRESRP